MATAKKTPAKKAAKRTSSASTAFTAEERAAMKDAAAEKRASKRPGRTKADGEAELLAKVKEMPPADRDKAERLHTIITEAAPELECRTWYGMPAYSLDGDVVCFYQSAAKFKARYAMLGFSDKAALDQGPTWPVYYAIDELTSAGAKEIAALIKRAVQR